MTEKTLQKALERIRKKIASNAELWDLIQFEVNARTFPPLQIQYKVRNGLMVLTINHLEKKTFAIHITNVTDSMFTAHTLRATSSTFDNLDKEALRLVRSVK